jgi:hypothetical protein
MNKGMADRSSHEGSSTTNEAEQNGCRQQLEGYLSPQHRLALAVA